MKARLCPHGNRDKMKNDVRKDSSTAQFDEILLLLSLASMLHFRLGCIDIKGAYLQSGPIRRQIYILPPPEVAKRGYLCKLLKLPYVITEAGGQWAKVIESWMIEVAGMQRVPGVSQLYVLRRNCSIALIIAKVTDDLLMAGSTK